MSIKIRILKLVRLILLMASVIGFSRCERLHLEYSDVNYVELEIKIDWRKCNQFIAPVSTVLFYKEGEKEPLVEYVMGSEKTIRLGEGSYSILAFNGRPYEFNHLTLDGLSSYLTAKAKVNSTIGLGPTGLPMIANADSLVCASKEKLIITKEMIDNVNAVDGKCPESITPNRLELWVQPLPVSILCNIYVEVDRLNLVRQNGMSIIISGIAKSCNLYNRQNNSETGSIITDSKINIDDTKVNGHISSKCFILGFPSEMIYPDDKDAPSIVLKDKPQSILQLTETRSEKSSSNSIIMDVELILKDAEKTVVRKRYDVSTKVTKKINLFGEVLFEINLTENPEDKIIVPNVTPENEQGLSPGVNDWGNEHIIDIPLNPKK